MGKIRRKYALTFSYPKKVFVKNKKMAVKKNIKKEGFYITVMT